jgi:probable F420-dependent oxidoreductase
MVQTSRDFASLHEAYRERRGVVLKVIYDYPMVNGSAADMLDPGAIDVVAARAEACGFFGLGFTDHPVPGARWLQAGGHQALDPFVALAFAAAATTELRLLTHLAVAPYRNPFILAKSAASVDKLSRGRLTLGLGTGYHKAEFFALGVDWKQRNALFDEALAVLPLHWSGKPFSFEGINFSVRDGIGLPRPVQDPIPVWIGGNSKRSLHRVAQHAQGWMPLIGSEQLTTTSRTPHIASLEQLAEMISTVRGAAAKTGRDDKIDILYSYNDRATLTSQPDAGRHRAAFEHLGKMGVTHINISSGTLSADSTLEFMESFAQLYLS